MIDDWCTFCIDEILILSVALYYIVKGISFWPLFIM